MRLNDIEHEMNAGAPTPFAYTIRSDLSTTDTVHIHANDDVIHIHNQFGEWIAAIRREQLSALRKVSTELDKHTFLLASAASITSRLHDKKLDYKDERQADKSIALGLHMAFDIDTELFASPTNVSGHMTTWFTNRNVDTLLGANLNAYSRIWEGLTYAHPPPREARRAVRWAINSAEAARIPTLCALLLPYTSVSNFKRDYIIKHVGHRYRTRVGTHTLATFHAHTLMLSTETESPDTPATMWKTAPTGYILLLVGNKEGLKGALNISDELKKVLENHLAQATKSKVTPEMDWSDPPDTPDNERRTKYGTTIEQERLAQTTAFKRTFAKTRNDLTDDDSEPNKIDDDENDTTEYSQSQETNPPTEATGNNMGIEIHEYDQNELDEWKNTKHQKIFYTDGSKGAGPAGIGVLMIDKDGTD
jgi:hypothetical protein